MSQESKKQQDTDSHLVSKKSIGDDVKNKQDAHVEFYLSVDYNYKLHPKDYSYDEIKLKKLEKLIQNGYRKNVGY